jgi:hypothetical protein
MQRTTETNCGQPILPTGPISSRGWENGTLLSF